METLLVDALVRHPLSTSTTELWKPNFEDMNRWGNRMTSSLSWSDPYGLSMMACYAVQI
jgi:hypothetical protein